MSASMNLKDLAEKLLGKAALGTAQEVAAVLNKGIDVDTCEDDENALFYAVLHNRLHIVELLVMRGADVDLGDLSRNMTPLSFAASFNFKEIADFLLKNKAAIDTQDTVVGYTALHRASLSDRVEIARLLLENRADYTIQDFSLNDPLQYSKSVAMRTLFEEQIAKDKIEKIKEKEIVSKVDFDVDIGIDIEDDMQKKRLKA